MSSPAQPYPWSDVAYHWRHWGPPLRPCAEDIGVMQEAVRHWGPSAGEGGPRALLLGVTPEIADMDWPAGTSLLAFDKSEAMVRVVWPGDVPGRRQAKVGNWLSMNLEPASRDVIIGDGCFALMRYPDGLRDFLSLLRPVARPGGLLIMRLFTRPARGESPNDVFAALAEGSIGSFHVLKWRLAMALQTDSRRGVQLADIWQTWHDAAIDATELAARTGWSLDSIHTIAHYQGKEAFLTFPTLAEFQTVLAEQFAALSLHIPSYELGERCPIVVYQAL
ncbi:MAG: hypothetical protein ACK4RK_10305 [Gemmataceae bacterium]